MQTEQRNSSAFDAMAAIYDESFTNTAVGKLQRAQVWKHLDSALHKSEKLDILELNCGTGHDAIMLAQSGHSVVATDVSQQMIEVAGLKAQHINVKILPIFQRCAFHDVASTFRDKKFDVIFSNFGGLNCISRTDLDILCNDLYTLLKPGGSCIMVIMGTKCCWERFYFLLKGKRKLAFRRNSKSSVMAATGNGSTETWYHSPKQVKQIFSSHFTLRDVRPVGLFVPPSYLNPFFEKHNAILGLLHKLDKFAGSYSFLSNSADHYIITFKRNDTTANSNASKTSVTK